eukprot:1942-Hanusia_phi.AAC.8
MAEGQGTGAMELLQVTQRSLDASITGACVHWHAATLLEPSGLIGLKAGQGVQTGELSPSLRADAAPRTLRALREHRRAEPAGGCVDGVRVRAGGTQAADRVGPVCGRGAHAHTVDLVAIAGGASNAEGADHRAGGAGEGPDLIAIGACGAALARREDAVGPRGAQAHGEDLVAGAGRRGVGCRGADRISGRALLTRGGARVAVAPSGAGQGHHGVLTGDTDVGGRQEPGLGTAAVARRGGARRPSGCQGRAGLAECQARLVVLRAAARRGGGQECWAGGAGGQGGRIAVGAGGADRAVTPSRFVESRRAHEEVAQVPTDAFAVGCGRRTLRREREDRAHQHARPARTVEVGWAHRADAPRVVRARVAHACAVGHRPAGAVVVGGAGGATGVTSPVIPRVADAARDRHPLREPQRGGVVGAAVAWTQGGGALHVAVDVTGLAGHARGRARRLEGARGAGPALGGRYPPVPPVANALAGVGAARLQGVRMRGAGRARAYRDLMVRKRVERAVLAGTRGVVEGADGAGDAVGEHLAVAEHVAGCAIALRAARSAEGVVRAGLAGGLGGRPAVGEIARPAASCAIGLISGEADAGGGADSPLQERGLVQSALPAGLGPERRGGGAVGTNHAGGAIPNPGRGDAVGGRVVPRHADAGGRLHRARRGLCVGGAVLAITDRGGRGEVRVGVHRACGTDPRGRVLPRAALEAGVLHPLVPGYAGAARDGARAGGRRGVRRAGHALAGVGDPRGGRVGVGGARRAGAVGDGGLVIPQRAGRAARGGVEPGIARQAAAVVHRVRPRLYPGVGGAGRARGSQPRATVVGARGAGGAGPVGQRRLERSSGARRAQPRGRRVVPRVAEARAQADGSPGRGGVGVAGSAGGATQHGCVGRDGADRAVGEGGRPGRRGVVTHGAWQAAQRRQRHIERLVRPRRARRAVAGAVRSLVAALAAGGAVRTRVPGEAIARRKRGAAVGVGVPAHTAPRAFLVARARLVRPGEAGRALAVDLEEVPGIADAGGNPRGAHGGRGPRDRARGAGGCVGVRGITPDGAGRAGRIAHTEVARGAHARVHIRAPAEGGDGQRRAGGAGPVAGEPLVAPHRAGGAGPSDERLAGQAILVGIGGAGPAVRVREEVRLLVVAIVQRAVAGRDRNVPAPGDDVEHARDGLHRPVHGDAPTAAATPGPVRHVRAPPVGFEPAGYADGGCGDCYGPPAPPATHAVGAGIQVLTTALPVGAYGPRHIHGGEGGQQERSPAAPPGVGLAILEAAGATAPAAAAQHVFGCRPGRQDVHVPIGVRSG